MRIVRFTIAALIAASGLTLVQAAPAQAATVVYVENHASTYYWPVGTAEAFVDQYTGSVIVFGACRSGYRCVKIYERTVRSSWAAVTYNWSWGSQIYLNPQRRWYSWYAKRSIVTHEMGHAFGLLGHNPYCATVMYGGVFCPNGKLPPYYFSPWERSVLARH